MDRNELKIMALRERFAQQVSNYEDTVADLRVELTLQAQRIKELEGESHEAVAQKADSDTPSN